MARLNLLLGILIIGLFVSGVSAYSYDSSFSGPPIAIDLGNTYSCIAGYETGQCEKTFQICIPTWVAFTDNATLVGEAAMNHSAVDPRRTLFGFKRFLGNEFADEDVQRGRKLMPYKIVEGSRYAALQVMVKDGEVEEFASFDAALVTAKVVSKLKEAAEAYLGVRVNEAFLLVPELWADAHVTAARDACRSAGLHILKTICESKAAAAAYGLKKKLPEEGTALIFHLGGGTASVTALLFEKGVFEIMTERHDVYLGGRDFDKRIVDYLVERIKKKHNKDVSKDKVALAKLRTASEHAKKALSNQDHVWVKVESLLDSVDFSEPLTRAKFEELNNDLFLKAIELVEQAVRDVEEEILDIRKELINEIVLVGGSSRIPKIQKLLKDYFDGKEPNMQLKPDEALSYGAALLTLPSTAGCYQGIADRRDFGHSVA